MLNNTHVSLLFYKNNVFILQTKIIDTLCYVLVILGLIGNILGLFMFSSSRRTWRISSIYAYLATSSSITNVLCVIRYAAVVHSTSKNILYRLVGQNWWACKFYEFSFSFRVISSWITLFWMFERLICVSRKLRTIINRCNSYQFKFIIPILILTIILICVIGPPLYMYQPIILDTNRINSTIDKSKTYCEVDSKASVKWKKYFSEIKFGINHFTIRCVFSELIPTGAVILLDAYIVYQLIRTHRHLHQSTSHHKSRTTSWMNIVLILHSFLFLASLISHVVGHFTVVEAHEAWWVLLAILINCSLNFYVYCLSGKAFRNEIRRFIQQLRIKILQKLHIQQQHNYNHNQVIISLKRRRQMI